MRKAYSDTKSMSLSLQIPIFHTGTESSFDPNILSMPTCNKSVIIKMLSMNGKGCSSTPPCIYSDYSVEEESMQFIGFNDVATFRIISRHEQTELYLFSEKVIFTNLFYFLHIFLLYAIGKTKVAIFENFNQSIFFF